MSTSKSEDEWSDQSLARDLEMLLVAGENQRVEFKVQFPKQVSDLGKEIAAFASTNAGTILLGIADDCAITGLEGADTLAGRQSLVARVEGLCANGVKPPVTPGIRFAAVGGQAVMAIDVPKGTAPIYYSANIPYTRQLTAARPMTPDEVVDAVLAWDRTRRAGDQPSPEAEHLSAMATLLVDVVVFASELDVRDRGDWLAETRARLDMLADQARRVAAAAPDECESTTVPLKRLAALLDIAAHERLTMSTGFDEMREGARDAVYLAQAMCAEFLGSGDFSEESVRGLTYTLRTTARKQDDLTGRIDEMLGRFMLDDLRSQAAENGLVLRKAAVFLRLLGNHDRGNAVDAIGARLRQIETRQIRMDGGRSQQAIVDELRSANRDLQALVSDEA